MRDPQRVVEPRGVLAAGRGDIALPATTATDRFRGDLIKDAAKAVGGGGGGKGDVATAGGKNPAGLDEALRIAQTVASGAASPA